MDELVDAVVVVTGASRGVGRATALRFAAGGRTVVAVARDRARLEVLETASAEVSGRVVAMAGDVRDAADAGRIVDDTERHIGPIDILVNNAGIERVKPLDVVSDADFTEMIDTNLRGVFNFAERSWSR